VNDKNSNKKFSTYAGWNIAEIELKNKRENIHVTMA
jgi:hypothetical protein